MQDIQEAFVSLFVAVVTGGIGLLTVYIQKYLSEATAKLKAETASVEDEILRDNVNYAISTIEGIIYDTVYSLQVSLVDDIKKASADGKLTKEEGEHVFNTAKEKILEQVPASLHLLATHSIENMEEYINLKIEESLERVKQELKGE